MTLLPKVLLRKRNLRIKWCNSLTIYPCQTSFWKEQLGKQKLLKCFSQISKFQEIGICQHHFVGGPKSNAFKRVN